MRSLGTQRRNSIGNAARLLSFLEGVPNFWLSGVIPKDRFHALACDSYARAMLSRLGTSRIPTSFGSLTCRGVNPCSTLPCSSDLRSCAGTSPTSGSAIAGKTARGGGVGQRATPMPFLCPARASAVDFLCPSSPLWPRHENANSYPVALGRYRPGAFRRWRLSDARRGAGRDRHAARDSPRSGDRRHRHLAIARDRLGRSCAATPREEAAMLDIILIAVGAGTFVLAIAYAYACDKL